MRKIKHPEIDSQFYEFRKMKAFLEVGVCVQLPGITHPPINLPQQYVNSQLFIDLISVLDNAVSYFFKYLNLVPSPGKKRFEQLAEIGQIESPKYFKWYKDLRNKSAHEFARHEWHFLDQATEHVANQLEFWGIYSAQLNFWRYYEEMSTGKSYVGSRVDDHVILAYEAAEHKVPTGTCSSAGLHSNLPFENFMLIDKNWSRRVIYSRAS